LTGIDDREALRIAFLSHAGLGSARREAMGGDASTRAYERLYLKDGSTRILMDQAPRLETPPCPPHATPAERMALGFNAAYRLAAGRVDAFVACAGYLRGRGLSAPAVFAADDGAGLAVLEDLGDDLYAHAIEAGADEGVLYDAAIDALIRLHADPPPLWLEAGGARWPLLIYDDLALKMGGDLFVDWLPKLRPALRFDGAALAEWEAVWAPIRARGEQGARVFCHRDYHAENLLWLPEREGVARVGLIDFQDALLAHPAWDLSMLLHDARRDIAPALADRAMDRYLAAHPALDREAFRADFRALGALNTCRIIGIFARLVTRDGKAKYEAMLPRLWGYLQPMLTAPDMAPLAAWIDRYVPPEARK
jgi:aminoglycoside/choline kinase family phosphotransferase